MASRRPYRKRKKSYHRSRNRHRFVDTRAFIWLMAILFSLGLLVVFVINRSEQQAAIDSQQAVAQAKLKEKKAKQAFIKRLVPQAQRLQDIYQILPSVTIAQAILESNWGQSQLSQKYHNLFGIKGTDPDNTAKLSTKEYVNGSWQTISGRFRVYASEAESMTDHAQLFHRGTTWNPQQYQHFLAAKEYRSAAQALQEDGYATDPDYADKLIRVIEQYHLNQYD